MKRIYVLAFCAATAIAGSTAANAAGPIFYRHENKATIVGHKIQVLFGQQLNVNCTSAAMPAFQIVMPPGHGHVSQVKEAIFPQYRAPDPRARCDTRKLPSLMMYYAPSAGFAGRDFMEVRIAYADGRLNDVKIDIDVR